MVAANLIISQWLNNLILFNWVKEIQKVSFCKLKIQIHHSRSFKIKFIDLKILN